MKTRTPGFVAVLLAALACHSTALTARAVVTFSVTPSAVSNLYTGPIALQIDGLNSGDTVQIDKYLDANANAVIDAADLAVQSFRLTDGQASVIGGVTNINVPGDFNPTNGAIRAHLRIADDVAQQIVAQYAFRLSSPTNGFTPFTNLFNVTNSAYAQSFTGAVRHGGTNVPNAVVMVSAGGRGRGRPYAGVMAGNSGNYTLNLPGGDYAFWLFKSNFVADLAGSPTLTLTNGTTFTTNLTFLTPATTSISGRFMDAANTNIGVPGVFLFCQTDNGQYIAGASYTGTNGAFSVPVIPGRWEVSMDSEGLAVGGYLDVDNHPQVDTTTGSVSGVTLALPKATALFYGNVFSSQGQPVAGVGVGCWDNDDLYDQSYRTDSNGYYVAGAVGGLVNDGWHLEVEDDSVTANQIFPQPPFNQSGGTNLNVGQAVLVNFTGLLATNRITGGVTNAANLQPVANVGVYSYAPNINGLTYETYTFTDQNGQYLVNVTNGTWFVGLDCGGGGENSLESLGFQCVAQQGANIANSNAVINFLVQPAVPFQITTTNLPSGTVGEYYSELLNAVGGQSPYTWWLPDGPGSLPPGESEDMVFSSDGNLSGTPGAAGTYDFPVAVSDDAFPQNVVTQWVSLTINSSGPDVVSYYVVRMESSLQVDPTTRILNTNYGPYHAILGLVQSDVGLVPIANVALPGGAVRALPWGSSGIALEAQESFPNQTAMDALYPPGDYEFALYALNDGLQFPILSMPPAAYPSAPRVSNFGAAQTVNPLAPFNLQWDLLPGATSNDVLWVLVTDTGGNTVFSTPPPATDREGALSGTATSVLIPTNTFQPGLAYWGWITFFRTTSVDLSGYPGAAGVTLVASQTAFPFAMMSTLPQLDQALRLSSSQFRFRLSGMTNQNYTVEVTTNLVSAPWFNLVITNLTSSPVFIQDNQATNSRRFYRVKLGP